MSPGTAVLERDRAGGAVVELVDSHCHLDFPGLAERLAQVRRNMLEAGVTHALCVSVTRAGFPAVRELARQHPNFYATVGIHPDQPPQEAVSEAELCLWADEPRVVAIGETGLDYYRQTDDPEW